MEKICECKNILKRYGIELDFVETGIRVTDFNGAVRHDEVYKSSAELFAYIRGLEDASGSNKENIDRIRASSGID